MPTIQHESSSSEIYLTSLLDAANTTSWKHALNILLINGTVLVAAENFKTPCLISQKGSIEKIQKALELLDAKGNSNIIPLLTDVVRSFAPSMMVDLKKIKTMNVEKGPKSDVLAKTTVVSALLPTLEKASNTLSGMVIEGAFKFSDLAAVWSMTTLGDLRKNQIISGISDQDYELMIDDLKRLGLIEPKVQISLCPECLNYELIVSKYPSSREICPKCGNSAVVLTLYLFNEQLGRIKSRNEDLPLFISAFLRQKMSLSVLVEQKFGIYPLEQILLDDEKKSKVEVDVRIPRLNFGIECKLAEVPVAPMTKERANSIASNLHSQMRKYVKVGITEMVIVTNLPEKHLKKMDAALKIRLENSPLPLNYSLVSGDIDELLAFLTSLSNRINKAINDEFTKTLEEITPIPLESTSNELVDTEN